MQEEADRRALDYLIAEEEENLELEQGKRKAEQRKKQVAAEEKAKEIKWMNLLRDLTQGEEEGPQCVASRQSG